MFRAGAVLLALGMVVFLMPVGLPRTETVFLANILGLQVPAFVLIFIGLRRAPVDFRWFMRSLFCVLTVFQLWVAYGSYTNDQEMRRAREAHRLELGMEKR